jgi:Xaa-Pro aminopeptidase
METTMSKPDVNPDAIVMAGIPATNSALYHATRFKVFDPTALVRLNPGQPNEKSILIMRDIEMDRARKHAKVDVVCCPKDFEPESGLSGDRETATAQAVTELLRREGAKTVVADRSLPFIYANMIASSGVAVVCDTELGVFTRRAKDAQEIEWLRKAQATTEGAIEMACRLIANATADSEGVLQHEGQPLTSERVRFEIDVWLLKKGFANVPSIIASGPQGADCHEHGSGPLKTGQPIIVDIFPQDQSTGYNGDYTRSVVHGTISDELKKMHAAVVAAKQAGQNATAPGVSGESVHQAVIDTIRQHGFEIGLPPADATDDYCAMVHGTGHGIGLEVHESPLLDFKGPTLVLHDALTIEPGLYCKSIGGLRLEDVVLVTENGCESLNQLPEGLDWKD